MADLHKQDTPPDGKTVGGDDTDSTAARKKSSKKVTMPTTDPTPTPQPERQPVLLPGEPDLMKELGLGRGVDGTSPTPWLNKTAFQVRKVNDKTIVGTEEGGTVQSYVREVTSVRSQQSTLKASIDVPKAPVTIGVDAEYSRTFTRSRKSVGNRVHNRSISFTSDFDDVSDWMFRKHPRQPPPMIYDWGYGWRPYSETGIEPEGTKDEEEEGGVKKKPLAPLQPIKPLEFGLTFEERMCKWILDEVTKTKAETDHSGTAPPVTGAEATPGESTKKEGDTPHPEPKYTSILDEFTDFFQSFASKKVRQIIDPHCLRFINYFRVTHYVCAIQLGAVKYEVMEEGQYARKIGGDANAAVEKIGELDFSTNLNWNRKVNASRASQIGVLRTDKVRGMVVQRNEEAVIGAKIKPLSSLIRHPLLRESLQRALKSYMDNVQDDREGPFLISCSDDKVFLKVNDQSQIVGDENHTMGSLFYLVPTYDSDHPHEFSITHFSEKKFRDIDPVPRYLNAPTNICGKNHGPLTIRFDVKEHESRLTLQSRLHTHYNPVEITPWVTGREAYYISCARRPFRKTGYICVKRRGGRYITTCVPSIEYHSDASRQYMVFRLIRPELFQGGRVKGDVEGEDTDDDEKEEEISTGLTSVPLHGQLVTSGAARPHPTREAPSIQAHPIELRKVESDI